MSESEVLNLELFSSSKGSRESLRKMITSPIMNRAFDCIEYAEIKAVQELSQELGEISKTVEKLKAL